jgi:hypothetical protein
MRFSAGTVLVNLRCCPCCAVCCMPGEEECVSAYGLEKPSVTLGAGPVSFCSVPTPVRFLYMKPSAGS